MQITHEIVPLNTITISVSHAEWNGPSITKLQHVTRTKLPAAMIIGTVAFVCRIIEGMMHPSMDAIIKDSNTSHFAFCSPILPEISIFEAIPVSRSNIPTEISTPDIILTTVSLRFTISSPFLL